MLIIAALFTAGLFFQSCGNENKNSNKNETNMSQATHTDNMDMKKMDHEMMQSMNGMMAKMNDMKMTGDFDLDFANMMILHHQAAIDISEVEITKGSDNQIKTMAQNIITAQKAEIEQLQQFVKNYKMPVVKKQNGEMHNELSETMKTMMAKMNDMAMNGNTDKDFVLMMIPHHEGAITMAENQISHGKNFELKKMAQKMIEDQSKEISEFKTLFANQK